jgi:hypothetical protein
MLSRCLAISSRSMLGYGFASKKIQVQGRVAELDGD